MTMMTNKVYDTLKFIAQIVLPSLGTLYFALSGIWGFPYGEQIVGTIAAIDAFLGAVLQISSNTYYQDEKNFAGTLLVDPSTETADFNFRTEMNDISELASHKELKVKVEPYEGKHEV